jgi:D-alanine-D-alanine ligase-like ATP-grasp enzyme
MRTTKVFCLVLAIAFSAAKAQSPAPIIVQPASAIPARSTSSVPVSAVSSVPDAIKLLEQIKAENDEVLAKQKTALERLEELQQAADQLRIFAKRG